MDLMGLFKLPREEKETRKNLSWRGLDGIEGKKAPYLIIIDGAGRIATGASRVPARNCVMYGFNTLCLGTKLGNPINGEDLPTEHKKTPTKNHFFLSGYAILVSRVILRPSYTIRQKLTHLSLSSSSLAADALPGAAALFGASGLGPERRGVLATSSSCSVEGFLPNHFSNQAPPIITVSTVLSFMSKQQLSKITPSMGRFSIGGTSNPKPSCWSKSARLYCRLMTHTSTKGMLLRDVASCGCCFWMCLASL
uniref:Uncharacterized protein n=1 Tax=Anopheles atroparvus TaxID=41427 RepID=A0A182J457_ANOAO